MEHVDPAAGPSDNDQKIHAARYFASHLQKGIRQIGMYRHDESKFPELLQKTWEALTKFTNTYGPLSIKVEQQNFQVLGRPLFSEDSTLPYKFFRDGVRQLIFRQGLPLEELVRFSLIALSETELGSEDVLSLLWKASLAHVEYIVVEGFTMDHRSEEEVEVEVDKIAGYLYSRLQTRSDDFLRFTRLSTADLGRRLEGIDRIRGSVIRGTTADDALKAKLQKEIAEEENSRLFPKLVNVVFQVVEAGVESPVALEEMFSHLLDALLLQEDFATINQILLKIRALEQRSNAREGYSRLRADFVSGMGDEQRILRIGEILRTTVLKHPQDVIRYLHVLDVSSVPLLLDVLESIEIPENRTLLLDFLATVAEETPDPFIHRLDSDRPQTVRDMVYVIDRANPPEKMALLGRVLKHQNVALRLDVLNIVSKRHTGEARTLVMEALNDSSPQVRMLAARLLPGFDRERAFADLTALIGDPNFEKRGMEEKSAYFAALGATALPEAFAFLTQLLQSKPTLLNRKRVTDDKLLAIQGVAAARTIQGYKLLQQLVEDKSQSPEILVAARKAMYLTKKMLFGDGADAEETHSP